MDEDTFGQTRNGIGARNFHAEIFFQRHSRTNLNFYLFSSLLTNNKIVFFTDVTGNGLINFIAANAYRVDGHGVAKGDYGNFGGTAANINNHVAGGAGNLQASSEGSGNGFFNDIGYFGPSCGGG